MFASLTSTPAGSPRRQSQPARLRPSRERGLTVEPYTPADAAEWDAFIDEKAANGTAFHSRCFLSYHPADRFRDASAMVRDGGRLVAIMPVSWRAGQVFSHGGSTYGGPVIHRAYYKAERIEAILSALSDHYGSLPPMRLPESVFCEQGIDALLYFLNQTHRLRFELGVYRDVTGIGSLADAIAGFSRQRLRSAARALLRAGHPEPQVNTEFARFHGYVTANLRKHSTTPTHTIEELLDLAARLDSRQKLIMGESSGTWMIQATPRCWHTFYIARDPTAPRNEMALVLAKAMLEVARCGGRYLNFGICTERQGESLNMGLIGFKEAIGGRSINRYLLV